MNQSVTKWTSQLTRADRLINSKGSYVVNRDSSETASRVQPAEPADGGPAGARHRPVRAHRTPEWLWCIAIFALAAFTDWLDGYLARQQGLASTLGRNLDPLVDKVVVCGAYIFLLAIPTPGLTPWMVVMVVARELIITGLRGFMENLGATFGAEWLGKIKMVLQCAALFAIFLALHDRAEPALHVGARYPGLVDARSRRRSSGLQYLWNAFALLNNRISPAQASREASQTRKRAGDHPCSVSPSSAAA